jgi:MFS family permease
LEPDFSLGAIILGAYIDRKGRRKGLVLTLALMSIGTLSIACVPGYATLGIFAPRLAVLGRLTQGFSAGVELGGVSVYLAEIATPGHKGFYVSWQAASQQCAVVFAALLGVVLSSRLTAAEISAIDGLSAVLQSWAPMLLRLYANRKWPLQATFLRAIGRCPFARLAYRR